MAHHIQMGKKAEELALNFLLSKGYNILCTNWRSGKKEIDIIAQSDSKLIIVEVKSRSQSIHPYAGEVVNLKKQRYLIMAAESYIKRNSVTLPVRFDIISIVFSGYKIDIEHIEDAFFPEPG